MSNNLDNLRQAQIAMEAAADALDKANHVYSEAVDTFSKARASVTKKEYVVFMQEELSKANAAMDALPD